MGNTSSTRNYVENKTNISITQNFVNTNIVRTQSTSTNINSADIFVGNADGCPISVKQSIISQVTINQGITAQNATELQNQLSSSLQNTAEQNASLINGAFAATGGNATNAVSIVKTNINQVIQTTLTATNIQKIANDSYNQNTGRITMYYCRNSPIEVDQNIVSNVITKNILYTLGQALANNGVISNVISHVEQTASQHNQGLNDIVDSIGKAILGPIGLSGMFLVLCCCILIIGLAVFAMSPAGKDATKQLVSKMK